MPSAVFRKGPAIAVAILEASQSDQPLRWVYQAPSAMGHFWQTGGQSKIRTPRASVNGASSRHLGPAAAVRNTQSPQAAHLLALAYLACNRSGPLLANRSELEFIAFNRNLP